MKKSAAAKRMSHLCSGIFYNVHLAVHISGPVQKILPDFRLPGSNQLANRIAERGKLFFVFGHDISAI